MCVYMYMCIYGVIGWERERGERAGEGGQRKIRKKREILLGLIFKPEKFKILTY